MQYATRFKEEGKVGVELLMTVSFSPSLAKKGFERVLNASKRETKEKKRTLALAFE